MPSPESAIVCNSGPLIALAGIGHLALLQKLYTRVLVCPAVHFELTASERFHREAHLFAVPWLEVTELTTPPDPLLATELDTGEAETLALAIQTHARRILIDERKGRRVATLVYQLPVIGTGGILLAAKQVGLVQNVRPLMKALRENGYYLSPRLVEGICKAAGE